MNPFFLQLEKIVDRGTLVDSEEGEGDAATELEITVTFIPIIG